MTGPGSPPPSGVPPATGESLLVIDNDPDLLDLLSFVFGSRGYTVLTAQQGTAGIALAQAHRPSVIVCDIIMDDLHGFEVLRTLREDPELARTVVVMISAKSYKPDIERARQMGADDYVVKPFSPDELVARVERLRADRAAPRLTVRFWGTRGSIAAPGAGTTLYGGNTACVELRSGQDILVFDAGTGIRELGLALAEEFRGRALTIHLFVSHTHWDHIQGFPFFVPAYSPGTTLHIYGSVGQGRSLKGVLSGQMDSDYFPVSLGDLVSSIHVHEYRGEPFRIGDVSVSATYLNHPGMALAYRVERAGKTVVYATDHEPYRTTLEAGSREAEAGKQFGRVLDDAFVGFVKGADLYIGEAQYTDLEYPAKVGWGHSSLSATVEVALQGGVKALALFHHDPMHSDDVVTGMEVLAKELIAERGVALWCFAAREGQTVEV
ncbi:MAG TPA: response regulator [Methylomirabilota bacterium]|jgi:DNA-binding response OmpR family regulator